jgi:hypothetical protein
MKRCPFCAEEIQDAAIACKHCGRYLTVTASPSERRGWRPLMIGAAVVAMLVVTWFVWALVSTPTIRSGSTDATDASHYPEFLRAIVGVGDPCDRVTRTFVAGRNRQNPGSLIVSVACADGHAYQLTQDAKEVKVLDCGMLYAVAKVRCFERLD